MKVNPTETQYMTVSRARSAFPPHLDLFIDNVPLTLCDSFKIFGVIFVKFAFEHHLRLVSSLVAETKSLLRFLGISQSSKMF